MKGRGVELRRLGCIGLGLALAGVAGFLLSACGGGGGGEDALATRTDVTATRTAGTVTRPTRTATRPAQTTVPPAAPPPAAAPPPPPPASSTPAAAPACRSTTSTSTSTIRRHRHPPAAQPPPPPGASASSTPSAAATEHDYERPTEFRRRHAVGLDRSRRRGDRSRAPRVLALATPSDRSREVGRPPGRPHEAHVPDARRRPRRRLTGDGTGAGALGGGGDPGSGGARRAGPGRSRSAGRRPRRALAHARGRPGSSTGLAPAQPGAALVLHSPDPPAGRGAPGPPAAPATHRHTRLTGAVRFGLRDATALGTVAPRVRRQRRRARRLHLLPGARGRRMRTASSCTAASVRSCC